MALEISSLSAAAAFPIANDDDSVTLLPLPDVEAPIWDAKAAGSDASGCLGPVAFRLGAQFTLRIKGSVTYPPEWENPAPCRLVGAIQGADSNSDKIAIFSAEWSQNLTGPPTRQGPEAHEFDKLLKLTGPLVEQDLASFLPFAVRGDVEWTLTHGPDLVQPLPLPKKPTTRLEIYWLCGTAPAVSTTAVSGTLIDLQGRWPVGLLRTFIPDPSALAGHVVLDKLKKEFWSWWAHHAIGRIRAHAGLSYEAAEGRSGYGVGWTGGSFDLQGWLAKTNPNINSFDLTALLEAAYTLLADQNPDSDKPGTMTFTNLQPRWVCKKPVGLAAATVPFAWSQDPAAAEGVMSPFFKRAAKGDVENCQVHAVSWLEIKVPDSSGHAWRVVQAAFGVREENTKDPFEASTAQVDRLGFLKNYVRGAHDEDDKLGLDVFEGIDAKGATCYTFDSFGPAEIGDSTFKRRVGLYDLRGINEPWPWRAPNGRPIPLLPMDRSSRDLVAKLLDRGRGKAKTKLVNDASLRPESIFTTLAKQRPSEVPKGAFQLKVGRGVSIATYCLPLDAGNAELKGVCLSVKIHVYTSYADALEAMAFELGKFECDLAEVMSFGSAGPMAYMDYVVPTAKSIFMICGNLFIDMTVLGLEAYGKVGARDALLGAAGRLSGYLAGMAVLPFQARKAVIRLVGDQPIPEAKQFKPLDAFEIVIDEASTLADVVAVHVALGSGTGNVKQPIILTSLGSPGMATRKLGFFVMRKEPEGVNKAVISIAAAHIDTFYPAERLVTVDVV